MAAATDIRMIKSPPVFWVIATISAVHTLISASHYFVVLDTVCTGRQTKKIGVETKTYNVETRMTFRTACWIY